MYMCREVIEVCVYTYSKERR